MILRPRATGKAVKLPKSIQEYMVWKYILTHKYVETLSCFELEETIDGQHVKKFYIFSPQAAIENKISLKNKLDLDRHPEILLFIGEINGQGKVYVADRRQPGIRRELKQGSRSVSVTKAKSA